MPAAKRRSGFPVGLREELQAAQEERERRRQKAATELSKDEIKAQRDQIAEMGAMDVAAQPAKTAAPTGRQNMIRTHILFRPDQIEFLDALAKASGKGVSRSDWVRHAVDRLAEEMERRAQNEPGG